MDQNLKERERKALEWIIDVAENRDLGIDREKEKFIYECARFAGIPSGTPFSVPGTTTPRDVRRIIKGLGMSKDDRREWPELMQGRIRTMLHHAIGRKRVESEYPVWESQDWNSSTGRYESHPDYQRGDANIEAQTLRIFYHLITDYGHRIKACKAPAPRKPGRKPKDVLPRLPESERTCGTVFIAERKTGSYCSDTCRNRVLIRNRRKQGVAEPITRKKIDSRT
jgi:hypothetical protein